MSANKRTVEELEGAMSLQIERIAELEDQVAVLRGGLENLCDVKQGSWTEARRLLRGLPAAGAELLLDRDQLTAAVDLLGSVLESGTLPFKLEHEIRGFSNAHAAAEAAKEGSDA